MDETAFWSTALGEWIRDCFCGTSNAPPLLPSVEQRRYRTCNGPSNGGRECRSASEDVLPERTITYRQLCDGYALNRLFQEIKRIRFRRSMDDPYFNEILAATFVDCDDDGTSGSGCRTSLMTNRLRLFHLLLRNLGHFYRDNSLCILSLPNTICIIKHPVPETSGNEMLKLVGLLLGAAVQADRRELFIDRIKALDPDIQHRLISEIQRVTTSGDTVLRIEDLNLLTQPSLQETTLATLMEADGNSTEQQLLVADDAERRQLLTALVDGLTRERDHYASAILEMLEEVVEPDDLLHPEAGGRAAAGSEEPCSSSSASSATSSTSSSSAITTITATTAGGANSDRRRHSAGTEADDFESGFESGGGGGGIVSAAALKTASSSTLSLTAAASAAAAAAVEASAAEHRHVSVELASAKAELRKLRVENEHKEELMLDLQEELEKRDAQVARLQAERLELVRDARAAKDYRDEIDCMQHKLMKLERLEAENEKLRVRLTEINYYKSQVNSLREDNDTIQETCRILEEQVEQGQRKLAAYLELEGRMIESQASVKSLQLDLAKTRERVEDLLVENGRLERECKQHAQTCGELERRIAAAADAASPRGETLNAVASRRGSSNLVTVNANADHPTPNDSSLLAQLDACNQSQILVLELENRKLKSQLEGLNDTSNPAEMFELRAELTAAERLLDTRCEEVTRLSAQLDATSAQRAEAEGERDELRREVAALAERNAAAAAESGAKRSGLQQQMADQTDRLKQKVSDLELDLSARDEQLALLRAEKTQAEAQLERMCAQLRDARAQLDVAEEAHRRAVDAADAAERQRRATDAERTALKARCATADDRLAEASVRALNAENVERRLADAQRQLVEKADALVGAESEARALKQQMELETRKTQRLREELVSERSRLADLLSRLRSVCAVAAQTNRNATASTGQPDATEKPETEEIDDDARLIATIDEILMRALSAARREADALRIQQQVQIRELDDLKRDIEGLRKVESELNASDGKYSETLLENRNIKEQVTLLQDRLRRVQLEEATRAAELQAARHEVDDLQRRMFSHGRQSAELVNVQLTLRHVQVQEELLRNENAELRANLNDMMAERNEALHSSEALSAVNTALAADHDRLQGLHQALAADYERARNENNTLKQRLKADKSTVESGLRAEFGRERSVLEEKLKQEMAERQHVYRRLVDCEAELARTANELTELRRSRPTPSQENQQGGGQVSSAANEVRRLRLLECAQKSTINNLNMTIQQLNNVLTEKDLEIVNLRRQIDMLRQYNGDESRSLIRQIELLLIQNQQLHTRSDAFYAEQKELQEKLATLRRHKEKLEEKIMDQYRAMDSRKVEPKPTLVRRAARALIAKSPGRKPKSAAERPATRNSADGSCGAGNGTSSNTEDSSIYSADEILLSADSTPNAAADGSGHSPPPPPAPIPLPSSGGPAMNGGGVAGGSGTPKPWTLYHHQQSLNGKAPGATTDAQPSTTAPSVNSGGGGLYSSVSHSTRATRNGSAVGTSNSADALSNGGALRARNGRVGGSLRYPSTNPRQPPQSGWPLGNGFLSNGAVSATFAGGSCGSSGVDPLRHDEQIHIGYYEEREVCSPQPAAASATTSATFATSVASPSASTASPVQRQRAIRAQPSAPHRRLGSMDSATCPTVASSTRPPPPPYSAAANRSLSMNGSGGSCRRNGSAPAATPPPYPGRMAGNVGSPLTSMKRNAHPPPPSSLPPTPPATTLRKATPPVVLVGFFPRDTSTPKGGDGGAAELRPAVAADVLPDAVAAEGTDRCVIRDSAERHEKAISVYENVNGNGNGKCSDENGCPNGRDQTGQKQPAKADDLLPTSGNELGRNGSKIWYEYGCV